MVMVTRASKSSRKNIYKLQQEGTEPGCPVICTPDTSLSELEQH